ncbi:molybdopterin-dependent oxidoreductase [Pseudonocardia sp. MCCB 268]|nr:molybdopterin-dependent oxidoreductase [Pseudonocardia cytotoxica]
MASGVYDIPVVAHDAAAAVTPTTSTVRFQEAGRPEAAAHLNGSADMAAVESGSTRSSSVATRSPDGRSRTRPRPGRSTTKRRLRQAAPGGVASGRLRPLRANSAPRERTATPCSSVSASRSTRRSPRSERPPSTARCMHPDGSATVSAGTSVTAGARHVVRHDRLGHTRHPADRISCAVWNTAARLSRWRCRAGHVLAARQVPQSWRAATEQARRHAATILEAAVDDIELYRGRCVRCVRVPSATVTWLRSPPRRPRRGRSSSRHRRDPGRSTYLFGAHVAVVEVDTDTGRVIPLQHVAVVTTAP